MTSALFTLMSSYVIDENQGDNDKGMNDSNDFIKLHISYLSVQIPM